jgi:hypothetical protein
MNTTSTVPCRAPFADFWATPREWAHALARRAGGRGRDALPVAATVALNAGATTWLASPLGRRVTCESGTLWLCFDGEPLDILLGPGDTHLCAKSSALSIHALSPGVVRLA